MLNIATRRKIIICGFKNLQMVRRKLSYTVSCNANNKSLSRAANSTSSIDNQLGSNISFTMNELNRDRYLSNRKVKSLNKRVSDNNSGIDGNIKKETGSISNVEPLFNNKTLGTNGNGKANAISVTDKNNESNNNSSSSSNGNTRTFNGLNMEDMIRMEAFFDSYQVVQDFQSSGFTEEESLLLMKYTYLKLKEKLEWLNQTYAPKVEMENEAYLFEAAHSELMFEVTNSREISLMNLTNGMIILKRAFNNLEDETSGQIKLNDDIIKMELNQFKHENNLHQKSLNLKNSDLNSRIVSDMVSGLKSEIEKFRWQITRAGIVSIMLMACCILGVYRFTKQLEATSDEADSKGPLLLPVHQQTDEESHDYEADWDEQSIV